MTTQSNNKCNCNDDNLITIDITNLKIPEEPSSIKEDNPYIDISDLNVLDRSFDNSELYINGDSCHPKSLEPTIPFIEVQNMDACEEPKYLLINNFLSEYNTNLKKQLVMLNILLLDKIPTEGSTKLINSGSLFNIMKENEAVANYLTTLVEELKEKVDSSDLSRLAIVAKTGSYNDLINKPHIPLDQILSDWNQLDDTSPDYIKNKPSNISEFINDAEYVTLDYFNYNVPIIIRDNTAESLDELEKYKLITVGTVIDALNKLNQNIIDDEKVISNSLNDLDSRSKLATKNIISLQNEKLDKDETLSIQEINSLFY